MDHLLFVSTHFDKRQRSQGQRTDNERRSGEFGSFHIGFGFWLSSRLADRQRQAHTWRRIRNRGNHPEKTRFWTRCGLGEEPGGSAVRESAD